MSGYCRDCGNTLCICKIINSNVSIEEHHKTYEELYFESLKIIAKAQQQLKEANEVIWFYDEIAIDQKAREYFEKWGE